MHIHFDLVNACACVVTFTVSSYYLIYSITKTLLLPIIIPQHTVGHHLSLPNNTPIFISLKLMKMAISRI